MTCIVGIKRDGKVVIASDSLTTLDSLKLVNNCNDPKIIKFPKFNIALAGIGPISELLEEFRKVEPEEINWEGYELNCRQDCIDFTRSFVERFEERFPSNEDYKFEFMVGTKDKLFLILDGGSAFEISSFWSIGSGSSYALGALNILYNIIGNELNIEDAASVAVETACKFDKDCQGPILIESIDN